MRFRNLFDAIVMGAIATSTSCRVSSIREDGFQLLRCPSKRVLLEGLRPAVPVDGIELRAVDPRTGASTLLETVGRPCASAQDVDACRKALSETKLPPNRWRIGTTDCAMTGCMNVLVVSRGDVRTVIDGRGALVEFLGPIDTPEEAVLLAQTYDYQIGCATDGNSGVRASADGGFDVLATIDQGCGHVERHLVHFARDGGRLTFVDGEVRSRATSDCSMGRRPAGLARVPDVRFGDPVGAWLASAARLEAASVMAFHVLERELTLHAAPPALVRAAARAAEDEVRHARVTRRLALRFGSRPARARVAKRSPRALREIAIENAIEGCVRETFGALVATWQSRAAADVEIAQAMRRIAVDETRHASLGWRVARWANPMLDPDERSAVARAKRDAIDELRAEIDRDPPEAVVALAGVPCARDARRMFDALHAEVWEP